MDQDDARSLARMVGRAARAVGVELSDEHDPDAGEVISRWIALGRPVSTLLN